MRILLVLAFMIAFSAPSYAQGEQTVVIKPDGTISIMEGAASPSKPKEEPKAQAPQKSAAPAQPIAPDTAPAAKPTKKPAAPKKKKAQPPAKQKAQKKKPEPQAVPVAPENAPQPPSAALPAQRLGPNMTPDDAIRITLDAAPPARSVHAIAVNYKGLHCYQVIFATEDGDRSLFVDRETGKLVQ